MREKSNLSPENFEQSSKLVVGYQLRIVFLALTGILVSCYLLYHHVSVVGDFQTGPSLCNFGGYLNCEDVARSQFSVFLGVPVASWGVVYYSLLLFLSAHLIFLYLQDDKSVSKSESEIRLDERARFASVFWFLAVAGLVPSFALLIISATIIKALCLFCSILYVLNLALFVLAIKNPDRNFALPRGFLTGGRELYSYLLTGRLIRRVKTDIDFRLGVIVRLGLTLVLVFVAFAPECLKSLWFEPRQAQLKSRESLMPILELWQKSQRHSNLVNEDPVQGDFSKGPKDAKITIVEFSDFECPYCQRASLFLTPLVEKFSGDVRIVFKNYPLDNSCNKFLNRELHKFACRAASLARCAGVNGGAEGFWKMHDEIFAQNNWEEGILESLPQKLGMHPEKLLSCMNDPKTIARIQLDIELGNLLDLEGTPTVYINGKLLGVPQREIMEDLIRLMLEDGLL